MQRLFLSLILALSFSTLTWSQEVKWLSFEKAVELNRENPKKFIVDVYTDWCKWCKVMDQNTFSHPVIAKYIEENYYPVKLDAEGKKPITLGKDTFEFVNNGRRGYHELAAALLQGKLSFPSVVFLDENVQLLQTVPGYNPPRRFDYIMRYFGNDAYKNTEWEQFQNTYDSPIKESAGKTN